MELLFPEAGFPFGSNIKEDYFSGKVLIWQQPHRYFRHIWWYFKAYHIKFLSYIFI